MRDGVVYTCRLAPSLKVLSVDTLLHVFYSSDVLRCLIYTWGLSVIESKQLILLWLEEKCMKARRHSGETNIRLVGHL